MEAENYKSRTVVGKRLQKIRAECKKFQEDYPDTHGVMFYGFEVLKDGNIAALGMSHVRPTQMAALLKSNEKLMTFMTEVMVEVLKEKFSK